MHNANLSRGICGFYDHKNKVCQKYDRRPDVCRMYPFLFGVEEGQIVVSASLECPGTGSRTTLQRKVISDLFNEPDVIKMIIYMGDCYEYAILHPDIWGQAHQVWKTLVRRVSEYFRHRTHFSFLQEIVELAWETVTELTKRKAPKIPRISVEKSINTTAGLYIATRFETYNLGRVNVRGSKTIMTLFDDSLKKVRKTKIKTPTKFSDLEIDKGAQRLLNDYVSFLCSRPFLSLAAIIANLEYVPVPVSLARTLAGSFAPLETGATLIAHRDNLETIDRDTMREIISFSEGTTHSTFARPDRVHRQ